MIPPKDRQQAVISQEMKKGGLRGPVNAFCASCIFDPDSGMGNWRQQVQLCQAKTCPLYKCRPTSTPKLANLSNKLEDFTGHEHNEETIA